MTNAESLRYSGSQAWGRIPRSKRAAIGFKPPWFGLTTAEKDANAKLMANTRKAKKKAYQAWRAHIGLPNIGQSAGVTRRGVLYKITPILNAKGEIVDEKTQVLHPTKGWKPDSRKKAFNGRGKPV